MFKKNPALVDLVHLYYNENKALREKLEQSEKMSSQLDSACTEIVALKNAKSALQKSNEKLITENTALKTELFSFSEKVTIDALPKQNQWLSEQLRVKTRLADKRALELGILERRIEELTHEKHALNNELGAVVGNESPAWTHNSALEANWEIERTYETRWIKYTARRK